MTSTKHEAASVAYKKALSHLEKTKRMLEEDAYCIDIIQQNLAIIGLLKSINTQLLEGHLEHCFREVMETGSEKKKRAMIKEILSVSKLSGR